MPEPFTIACPTCDLRLQCQPSASGKRLQCPGCRSWMMVPAAPVQVPEPEQRPVEFDNYGYDYAPPPRRQPVARPRQEFDEFFDYGYDPYAAPPRPRRRKRSRKKKKPSKPKWVLPTAIAGGSVVGLLLVGLLFYWIARGFSVGTLDVEDPVAYVTVDTEMVVVLRFNEIEQVDGLTDEIWQRFGNEKAKRALSALGVDADDVSLIAVGFSNASDEADMTGALRNGAVVVVQSKKKLSRWKPTLRSVKCRHAGKEYLRDRHGTHGIKGAVFFANERTIVAASETTVKKLLEIDRPSTANGRFAFADFNSSVVIAYAAKNGNAVPTTAPANRDGSFSVITETASLFTARLSGLAVCRKLDNGVEGTTYAMCSDQRAAAGVAASLMQSPQRQRAHANNLMPDAADDALRNLRITTNGPTVVVSTRLQGN